MYKYQLKLPFFGANDFKFNDFFPFFREDKGDQILDYKQEIQTMEEQLKKVQKEVRVEQRAQPTA